MPKDPELEKLVAEEQRRQSRRGAEQRAGFFTETPYDPGARQNAPSTEGWPLKPAS